MAPNRGETETETAGLKALLEVQLYPLSCNNSEIGSICVRSLRRRAPRRSRPGPQMVHRPRRVLGGDGGGNRSRTRSSRRGVSWATWLPRTPGICFLLAILRLGMRQSIVTWVISTRMMISRPTRRRTRTCPTFPDDIEHRLGTTDCFRLCAVPAVVDDRALLEGDEVQATAFERG